MLHVFRNLLQDVGSNTVNKLPDKLQILDYHRKFRKLLNNLLLNHFFILLTNFKFSYLLYFVPNLYIYTIFYNFVLLNSTPCKRLWLKTFLVFVIKVHSTCLVDWEACPQSLQLISPWRTNISCQMIPKLHMSSDVCRGLSGLPFLSLIRVSFSLIGNSL